MDDDDRTREQLIEEVEALRKQVADLGDEVAALVVTEKGGEPRTSRTPRSALQTPITFIGNFSLVQAQGIDLSEGGVCFEVAEDLPFEMEFEIDGEVHQHQGVLVWMKKLESGSSRWGFKFVPAEELTLLNIYKKMHESKESD